MGLPLGCYGSVMGLLWDCYIWGCYGRLLQAYYTGCKGIYVGGVGVNGGGYGQPCWLCVSGHGVVMGLYGAVLGLYGAVC